jgi:hypothetical protein
MTKFSIIILHEEEMHFLRRNATIPQKIMDNEEECKNSWTRRNAKISWSPYIISAHTASSAKKFPPAVITYSMRNVAILSRTFASNDLSRGCSSSPMLWI